MRTINKIVRRDHGFTQISNDVLRNAALSFRARGILAMILSHSAEWVTTHKWIETQGTEGREAVRSALAELEAVGHLVQSQVRVAGVITGHLMTWHESPVAVEPIAPIPTPQGQGTATRLPAPDDHMTASRLPAPSEENGPQKKISKISKKEFPMGCDPAPKVDLDLTAPDEIKRLWSAYQDYRTERHNAKGKDRLAWTETAARMAAEQINRALLTIPEKAIADHLRSAIVSQWKGLHLSNLSPSLNHDKNHPGSNQPRQSFEVLKTANGSEHGADFTGEIR